MSNRDLPRLFHIGTQKAGTSYLYHVLKKHPGLSLSELTELHYYSLNYEKGVDWYLGTYKGGGMKVDISPKEFLYKTLPSERIAHDLGAENVRIILTLRNPIDYLNSHFCMQIHHGFFKNNPSYPEFTSDLVAFVKRYPAYLERGMYYEILSKGWVPHIPKENIHIIFFENFIKNPTESTKEMLRFWNVQELDLSTTSVSQNRLLRFSGLQKIRDVVMKFPNLKEYLRENSLFEWVYKKILTTSSKEKLSSEHREYLADIFIDDVRQLEEFVGREIVEWKDFA